MTNIAQRLPGLTRSGSLFRHETTMTRPMKNTIATVAAALAMLSACHDVVAASSAFAVDSLSCERTDSVAEVSIKVDFPVAGPVPLVNAVREYVSEQLGGTYSGDLADGNAMLAHYAEAIMAELHDEEEDLGDIVHEQLSSTDEIKLVAETDQYVTFVCSSYCYLGGAHGTPSRSGVTFRKSDGRRVGFEMLRNTEDDEFRSLIKEGLKTYFSEHDMEVETDDDLMMLLNTDAPAEYLPLPVTQPYLLPEGLVLTYHVYEIAPFYVGMPTFVIDYDSLRPYMKHTLEELVGGRQEQ